MGTVERRPRHAAGSRALPRPALLPAVAVCAALAGLLAASSAGSGTTSPRAVAVMDAGGGAPCPPGVSCSRVRVPLDWSGRTSGTVSLWVEVRRPRQPGAGVVFLLAGGPGEAATRAFDLGSDGLWPRIFPGDTLVTFDPRGTGDSDAPSCQPGATTAACAQELGPDRRFYTTRANVLDVEAVRRELGFPRIDVFAVSYGTEVALDYARAFPRHVQRLVLDSISQPSSSLPALSIVLHALPTTLRAYCSRVCDGVTPDYGRDVVALANSLSTSPLQAPVLLPNGRTALEGLDAVQFLDLVSDSDLNPWLAAVLPAAVQAARVGDPQPLLRLAELDQTPQPPQESIVNEAVYTATVCNDGPFPWPPGAPLGQRLELLTRSLAALPANAFGGLGRWAVELGNAYLCLTWPHAGASASTVGTRTLPDVPVLAIAGEFDLRATASEARAVLRHLRRGQLLTVLNAGHSAVTNPGSACVFGAIRLWLGGRHIAAACTARRVVAPVAGYPLPGHASAGVESAGRALWLARVTLREAEAMWRLVPVYGHDPTVIAGVSSGRLAASANGFALTDYGISRAVRLTGELRLEPSTGTGAEGLRGTLTVRAPSGSIGLLTVDGGSVSVRQ